MAAQSTRGTKPFFMIVTAAEAEREGLELRDLLKQANVLTFASAERAAVAYSAALGYWSARRAAAVSAQAKPGGTA